MSPSNLLDAGSLFRRHPDLELLPVDTLDHAEQEKLGGLSNDPGSAGNPLWGIARRAGQPGQHGLSPETALLLFTLEERGPLPAFVRFSSSRSAIENQLAALILDGLLEIRRDGRFLSGPNAIECIGRNEASMDNGIGGLSSAALRHAAELKLDDPIALSWRLYNYHRVPLTPQWASRLPNFDAVEQFLGLSPGTAARGRLDRYWRQSRRRPGWIDWRRRTAPSRRASGSPSFKLYISPEPRALPRVVQILMDCLSETPAFAFKIGDDAVGVLRPDKLILYFATLDDLLRGAETIGPRLDDFAPQGVPFTAEIAGRGLLSWGLDPPLTHSEDRDASNLGSSWRRWVVERLAVFLVEARREPLLGCEPCDFARERLRLDGIDVESWTPSLSLFAEGHRSAS